MIFISRGLWVHLYNSCFRTYVANLSHLYFVVSIMVVMVLKCL